jgi:hypothetical protein
MLNFASSNVVICYQYHIHNAKVVTMIAMTNNMLNTTPIISNPLIMIARHNIKLIFFFIYANIMQNHQVIVKQYKYYELSSSYACHRVRTAMLINWKLSEIVG